jgi:hypothetical protein
MRRSAGIRNSVFRSVCFVVFALSENAAVAGPPIIDMHVHAKNAVQEGPQHPLNVASMHDYEAEADANNIILFVASGAH